MSPAPVIARIARLLHPAAPPEKQIAAALVLGELRARDAEAVTALIEALDSPLPAVQRHVLAALGAIAAPRGLPRAVALLGSRDDGVRAAARDAVAAFGDAALPAVRARLAADPPPPAAEKRALDEILARLGGRDALSALLDGLASDDLEAARAATLPMRQRLKEAEPRERRRTLDQAAQFLGSKRAAASPAARLAAVKILGFLEDPAAVPPLLARALERREAEAVRMEAVIALRLAARTVDAKLADRLLGVAETAPVALARAALYSLVGTTFAAAAARAIGKRLAKLAVHSETDRAVLAIELLAGIPGAEAAGALSRVLLDTTERARAEAAAQALERRTDAVQALVQALLATRERERAQMIAALLRSRLRGADAKVTGALARAAARHLEQEHPCAEPVLQAARAAAPGPLAEELRALAEKLRKARRPERALAVLRVLGRSADASPEDGYALAALELGAGHRDEAFAIIGQLLDRGFDVAAAMRKDRSLDPERRYQVGFHFAERGHPLGEEVLTGIVESGGRTKVAQMARAKLRSSGL